MKITSYFKTLGSALLLLGLVNSTMPSARAQGKLVKRDLQEWLDAQGSVVHPQLPKTPRLFAWTNDPDINGDGLDDGPRYIMWYDYAGVLARETSYGGGALGPASIDGTVTERAVGDGMAEVTVSVKLNRALIWVTTFAKDPTTLPADWFRVSGPTVFGHRESEIEANPGLEPAWANIHFTATFLNEVGADMPDLRIASAAGRWLSFQVVLNATGPLTEAYGVPEGTPGALHWGKPGTLTVPANENAGNGAASGFPNDEFHLFPVGRR